MVMGIAVILILLVINDGFSDTFEAQTTKDMFPPMERMQKLITVLTHGHMKVMENLGLSR